MAKFLGSTDLRLESANSDPLLCRTVVDGKFDDAYDIAFVVGRQSTVLANGECWGSTSQETYSTHCARGPCVEYTNVKISLSSEHPHL